MVIHLHSNPSIKFPHTRPRRLRLRESVRDLVAETLLTPSKLILPVFVSDRVSKPAPIESIPNHYYYPPQSRELVEFIQKALELRIGGFLLFGTPLHKDSRASSAYSSNGVVQRAVKHIRRELGFEPTVFTDLCICSYTDHGHCGLVRYEGGRATVDNDSTLEVYRAIAVSHAEAGADFVAPSGMMDGQVRAIREALDNQGFTDVGIMSYSAKFASSFYGPFRAAMDSAPRFGDRRSYQMDPRNAAEALKEVLMDVEEGADIVMVKPALAYLDIVRMVKEALPYTPLAVYNVSGEYMAVELLSRAGYIDRRSAVLEILTSIFRAGADMIITYHALEAASTR
ncbi:MAG: porphobilinogen synthase [Ignisphaera sp.]|nr:porphobilinogen synthase [Ignisphaera sp.]